MTIDQKLAKLAALMADMASNDMGDLKLAEAALFHTACDAIDNLIEARGENEQEDAVPCPYCDVLNWPSDCAGDKAAWKCADCGEPIYPEAVSVS